MDLLLVDDSDHYSRKREQNGRSEGRPRDVQRRPCHARGGHDKADLRFVGRMTLTCPQFPHG